ncbi:MAG: hypothetical protein ACE5KE_06215 [Methanosarcinales archaeon]
MEIKKIKLSEEEQKKVLEKVLGFMKYFPEVTPEDFKKERKNGE